MQNYILIILLLVPLICFWWLSHRKSQEITQLKIYASQLETKLSEAEKSYREKLDLASETKEKMSEIFKGFSLEAMEKFQKKSQEEVASKEATLIQSILPVKEGLAKLDLGMQQLEKERKGESESLREQIRAVLESEKQLRDETANLVKALRKPDVRGSWGELQLKRVVELSGMLSHCDFYEQQVESGDEGRVRPDLLIRLPGDRQVIVDAKAPFDAFLDANQQTDPQKRDDRLKDHARVVRQHIIQLGKKNYWQQFKPNPEFVILFLPTEIFFTSALQFDPTLVELGAEQNVILATPMTLIGLLRSIAYGWKQDKFSKHAQEISLLGHELYKRLSDLSKHWTGLGRSLTSAVENYNKAMGSFERRVLVSARKFKEFGAAHVELELEPIDFIEKIPYTSTATSEDST